MILWMWWCSPKAKCENCVCHTGAKFWSIELNLLPAIDLSGGCELNLLPPRILGHLILFETTLHIFNIILSPTISKFKPPKLWNILWKFVDYRLVDSCPSFTVISPIQRKGLPNDLVPAQFKKPTNSYHHLACTWSLQCHGTGYATTRPLLYSFF